MSSTQQTQFDLVTGKTLRFNLNFILFLQIVSIFIEKRSPELVNRLFHQIVVLYGKVGRFKLFLLENMSLDLLVTHLLFLVFLETATEL